MIGIAGPLALEHYKIYHKSYPSVREVVLGTLAYQSGELEGAGWDRWELHKAAILEAYELGRTRMPLTMYHFFKWHGMILPHGGILRACEPVSRNMGDSFRPVPAALLPAAVNTFIRGWCTFDQTPAWEQLAQRHFRQWQIHPFPDGNKRHARLMTVYGCGWFGFEPVCLTLTEKAAYLDALDRADIRALAHLFGQHQIWGGWYE